MRVKLKHEAGIVINNRLPVPNIRLYSRQKESQVGQLLLKGVPFTVTLTISETTVNLLLPLLP